MITDINSEDRAVQHTFAEYLAEQLGWESVYAWNQEDFGPDSLLGRASMREVVLKRDLQAAIERLNPGLPPAAVEEAVVLWLAEIDDLDLWLDGRSFLVLERDRHAVADPLVELLIVLKG